MCIRDRFKVIEEDRAEAIKQRVIQRVLDECYEAPDEGFKLLADSVGAGRSDDRLAETVLALHRKTQSLSLIHISGRAIKISLSIAIALAMGIAMLRVVTGISIMWFLVP